MPRKRPCFSSSNHSKLALRQEKALKIRTDWVDRLQNWQWHVVAAVSKQGFTTLFALFYTSPGYHTTNHQVWGDQYLNINMIKERKFWSKWSWQSSQKPGRANQNRIKAFWDAISRSLVQRYQRFEGATCFHVQDIRHRQQVSPKRPCTYLENILIYIPEIIILKFRAMIA